MTKKTRMKEYEIVQHISAFLTRHKDKYKLNTNPPKTDVDEYLNEVRNLNDADKSTLKAALMAQHNAMETLIQRRATNHYHVNYYPTNNFYIYPIIIPGPGHWHGHHHGGIGGGNHSGDAILVICAIAAVASALVAAYGMVMDLSEIGKELWNSQRVTANLATLALTGAFVAGATVAAVAIFASNPVGWGVVAAACLIVGVALLVKMTRLIVNAIDASLNEESGLTSDSRFQLTHKEELTLTKAGFSSEEVQKVKEVIRGLAVRASNMSEMGFIGSDDEYLKVIDVLTDVKKGIIPPELRDIYKITSGVIDSPQPDLSPSIKTSGSYL